MDNSQIAKVFYEIADLLELKGVEFKPRAYRKAAKNIDDFPESMSDLYKKAGLKSLREIPGVGAGIFRKKYAQIMRTTIAMALRMASILIAGKRIYRQIPQMHW